MGVSMGIQLRGKEVIRIQNFKVASKEDVAAVHSMGYVKGLERVSHCYNGLWISLRFKRLISHTLSRVL